MEPKRVERRFGKHVEYVQDIFEFDEQEMLKNMKIASDPDVQRIPHRHRFRTVNRKGVQQTTSTAVGGHFHEVRYWVDAQGNLRAKCGPPLRMKRVRQRNGRGRVWRAVPVTVPDPQNVNQDMLDEHIHDVVYSESYRYTSEKHREAQQVDKDKYQKMFAAKDELAASTMIDQRSIDAAEAAEAAKRAEDGLSPLLDGPDLDADGDDEGSGNE